MVEEVGKEEAALGGLQGTGDPVPRSRALQASTGRGHGLLFPRTWKARNCQSREGRVWDIGNIVSSLSFLFLKVKPK